MIITIHEVISNILTQNRELVRTNTSETYILTPDERKALKNLITGEVLPGQVGVNKEEDIKNYTEIDKEIDK